MRFNEGIPSLSDNEDYPEESWHEKIDDITKYDSYHGNIGSSRRAHVYDSQTGRGFFNVGYNESKDIEFYIREDWKTEENENFQIKIYSDKARKHLLGETKLISIIDNSQDTPIQYDIVNSKRADHAFRSSTIDEIEEGSGFYHWFVPRFPASPTYIREENHVPEFLYWQIEGVDGTIDKDDFSNDLEGSFQFLGADHVEKRVNIFPVNDEIFEGPESFVIKWYTDPERSDLVATSESVTIYDYSPPFSINWASSIDIKSQVLKNAKFSITNNSPNLPNETSRITLNIDVTGLEEIKKPTLEEIIEGANPSAVFQPDINSLKIYWSLTEDEKEGETATDDFYFNSYDGSFFLRENKTETIELIPSLDGENFWNKEEEGNEQFTISLYADSEKSILVGSQSFTLEDTSKATVLSYQATNNKNSLDEGAPLLGEDQSIAYASLIIDSDYINGYGMKESPWIYQRRFG